MDIFLAVLALYLLLSLAVGAELATRKGNVKWRAMVVGFVWPIGLASAIADAFEDA